LSPSEPPFRIVRAARTKLPRAMGSLIKKRRKRMRKKKHRKMLKRTRFQRRAAGK
jgi:hypothetical protein